MEVADDGAVYLPENTRIHKISSETLPGSAVDKFIDEQDFVPETADEEFWDFFVYGETEPYNELYHYVARSRKNKDGEILWTAPQKLTSQAANSLAEAKQFEFHFL
jgi:hypothetical protein